MDEQDQQPTGRNYPELLRALMAAGVDVSARNVMGQINAQSNGAYGIWCVRIEDGRAIYLGRVTEDFNDYREAGAQIARLPDDLMDMIEAKRKLAQ